MKRKLVVLSGAGISAESGIKTFRDSGGLWEEYDISEVATPQAWQRNPKLVLKFYNERRKQVLMASPNAAHYAIADLEKSYSVKVITQNVDDLHERAGSTDVIHLHGEIIKSRSSKDSTLIYNIEGHELLWGQTCELGSQLRPHIVWFGEMVPEIDNAIPYIIAADVIIIVGTSLAVYPAAGLVDYAQRHIQKYLIDPNECNTLLDNLTFIQKNACEGVPLLAKKLLKQA